MNAVLKMIMCRKIWRRGEGGTAVTILGSEAAMRGIIVEYCLDHVHTVRFPLSAQDATFDMRTLSSIWTVTVYFYLYNGTPQCWVQREAVHDRVRSLELLEHPNRMLRDAQDMPQEFREFIEKHYGKIPEPTPIWFGKK